MEPQLRCIGALHSPSTGIIDAHELMIALLGDAEAHGACLVPNVSVDGGVARPGAPIELKLGGCVFPTFDPKDGMQFPASTAVLPSPVQPGSPVVEAAMQPPPGADEGRRCTSRERGGVGASRAAGVRAAL